jgi:hypothetical protein
MLPGTHLEIGLITGEIININLKERKYYDGSDIPFDEISLV